MTHSRSPGVITSKAPPQPTPALLQTTCTLPNTSNASFAARCTDEGSASVIAAGTRSLSLYLQSCRELEKMTTTTIDVSEALERVDNIVNTLDEICDHMEAFRPPKK